MKKNAISLILFLLVACKPNEAPLHGYVEGEYLYMAPTTSGILKTLSVQRGDLVKQGQDLFAIDEVELNTVIASVEAERLQAKAKLDNATKEFNRAKTLIATYAVSQADFDQRKSEIESAQAVLDMTNQKLIKVRQQLQESAPKAPMDSYVENTFFRAGEYIPAGKAVVSILPPDNIKIRFFIPQSRLPELKRGQGIRVTCDGCKKPVAAKISYISSQEEFTPPVIYSTESRQKLVFMVEAIPDAPEPMFHPGLPVDITFEAL